MKPIAVKKVFILPNDPILNTKYIAFKMQNLMFCAYDSYVAKAGSTQTFTGVYCPIRLKPEMELEKYINPIKLIIQHNYIPIISELKGKQVIGLETNQWISKKEEVDQFLNLGDILIKSIIKASERFF